MDDRRHLSLELDQIQRQLKELEIRYEQYFAGIERREPLNDRRVLSRRLRQFTNRHIVWTDLNFRYQNLASRFMSYNQYWDRILRLMDEGKYHRHTAKLKPSQHPSALPLEQQEKTGESEATRLQRELKQAKVQLGLKAEAPGIDKIAQFLADQREKIRARYGEKDIIFSVDSSSGKPRIKASLKK